MNYKIIIEPTLFRHVESLERFHLVALPDCVRDSKRYIHYAFDDVARITELIKVSNIFLIENNKLVVSNYRHMPKILDFDKKYFAKFLDYIA